MKQALILTLTIISLGIAPIAGNEPQSQTGDKITLKNSRQNSPRLVEILNHGYVEELNKLSGGANQSLSLRLWLVPIDGNCMPDTHYVCSNHYYLAVTTNDIGFDGAVYDLGEVGEINDIKWMKSEGYNTARLSLRVTNYPEGYFKYNKNLVRKEKRYQLFVTTDRLTLKVVK